MRVVIDPLAYADADPTTIEQLRAALEPATFAESCCIGGMAGVSVIVRCPDTPHGVIVNTAQLNPAYLRWVLNSLAGSVSAGGA